MQPRFSIRPSNRNYSAMRQVHATSARNKFSLFFERFAVMPWHGSINAGVIHIRNRGHNFILSQLAKSLYLQQR